MSAEITKIVDDGIAPVKVREGYEYILGRIILYVSIDNAAPVPIVGYTNPNQHAEMIRHLRNIQWVATDNHQHNKEV